MLSVWFRSTNTSGCLSVSMTPAGEMLRLLLDEAVPCGAERPTSFTPLLFRGRLSLPGLTDVPSRLPTPHSLLLSRSRPVPSALSKACTTNVFDTLRRPGQMGTVSHLILSRFVSAPPRLMYVAICVARVRLLCRLVQRRSSFAYDILEASWDRAGRWTSLLQQAVRTLWHNTSLPPLASGGPTLALLQRSTRELARACRRVSQHGTMLQALHHMWTSFGQSSLRGTIGQAAPQLCPECGATLPSRHALAAHLHRMHGRVALCTQYTLGSVCLWCLLDFHNTDRLRYHLLHSPACEHGLRCVVGPVYEYGSGSKRSGKKGHLRAPVQRVCGPLNASPAPACCRGGGQGMHCPGAAGRTRPASPAPGPSFSSQSRSTPVLPRPASAPVPSANGAVSPVEPAHAVQLLPQACMRLGTERTPLQCFSFADFAHPDDWLLPSLHWHRPIPHGIWMIPSSWHICWRFFRAIHSHPPWSQEMWRCSSFLRREAAPRSDGPRSFGFAETAAKRLLFLRRMVTFRLLLRQVELGSAIWTSSPPDTHWMSFLRNLVPAITAASTIPMLGFGTLLALPHVLSSCLRLLPRTDSAHARLFRLAAPHFHCSTPGAAR